VAPVVALRTYRQSVGTANFPAVNPRAVGYLFRLALSICILQTVHGCGGQGERDTARPNIVFILVDDLRWDDIAIAGHPFAQTPAIDQLAREGTRFLNAFATTPLCSPSRAAILTGQYAHTNGIIDNTARDSASHRLATFAIPLAAAGYETGFFGKWHMGNDDTRRPGWTRWVAMKGQGEAINPKLNVDGERIEATGYVTDVLTDYAVRFMEQSRGKPFLVFLAHKALHPNVAQRDDGSVAQLADQGAGFIPADRHRGRYAQSVVPRRPNATEAIRRKPALQRAIAGLPPLSPATGTPDKDVRDRLEMLLGVDESLQRIRQTLADQGALENTLFIFTSDHGYFYGEHGLNEERRLAYEETARIPLIVRYPSVARAASTPAQLVQVIDLAPTVLAMAGVTDTVPRQGISLVPLLDGSFTSWRQSVLLEYYSDRVFPRMLTMGYQAVRTERHKYIHYLDLTGMDELYDLAADPFEMNNLLGTPAGDSLLPALQTELARLQRSSGYSAGFAGHR
jgi:N-acetylglucosamine-6-sulfatase